MIQRIENESVGMAFDPQRAAIVSLLRKATQTELILHPDAAQPIFGLVCLNGQQKSAWQPAGEPQVERVEGGLNITYEQVQNGEQTRPLHAVVCLSLTGPEVTATLALSIPEGALPVVETVFPRLGGLMLSPAGEQDVLIYPHHAGEKILTPAQTLTSERYLGFGRAQSHAEEGYWWREINYCGLASMTWMDVTGPADGLYFASHDPHFDLTGVRVETGGPEHPWLGLAFRKYRRILPGQSWTLGTAMLALHGPDWHWGARRYRSWLTQYVQAQPNPEYLKDEFSLTKCYALRRENQVQNTYDRLPDLFEAGKKAFDARHLFIASWNRGGFDWNYPEYQPDMDLGTPLDLYRAIQEVRQKNGFVTFYINARIYDTQNDYFKTLGRPWAIKNERGELSLESYDNPRTFSVTCPAHGGWQKYLADTACWMVQAYGAKGIYYDQLGSAEPFPCYDASHTHADIGDFNRGYVALLEETRTRLKALDPDTYLMIENCGDLYSPYVWGNLVWNGDPLDEFFNVYKYTFPEYVLVHMVNPLGNRQGAARKERFYRDMQRATLLGAIFWLGTDKFLPEDAELFAYMRQVVPFRARLNALIRDAVYVDTDGVLAASSGVQVSHWQMPAGRHLYIIGNLEARQDAWIEIEAPAGAAPHFTGETLSGQSVEGECEVLSPNCWRVPVPPETLSFVVIGLRLRDGA